MGSVSSIESTIDVREAEPQEDSLLAEHFYRLWRDNNIAAESIRPDWEDITLQFIQQARRELSYKAWVAEVEGAIVGSAGCQLFAGLYPLILADHERKYGYIWGVYVEPAYRGQGIANQLTQAAIAHLKTLHCTRAILHASPSGKPIYTRLGFCESNEMRLDLID